MRFAIVILSILWAASAIARPAQPSAPGQPPLALEAPECAVSQSGRADCLLRDRAGAFVWMFHDGRRWSKPVRMGGAFAGPASCVVRGPLGLNCFAIRADGTLWHSAMNGGAFRAWRPLGGRLALGRPSCVAPARNQIVCHARARNGALAIKAWLGDAAWQEWRVVGGALAGDPSCVRLGFDRTACFWRRKDGQLSGLIPAEAGPGAAIVTLPRKTGQPACTALGGQTVSCLSRTEGAKTLDWRGGAVLGGFGIDGFSVRDAGMASDPVCAARADRTFCVYMTASGDLSLIEANAQGWTDPAILAGPGAAHAARCFAFDQVRMACAVLTPKGELRAVFREYKGAPGTGLSPSVSGPVLSEKPEPPAPRPATVAVPQVPASIATVSTTEPLGAWRVFEPRSGLYCQIELFDAPAQPYRSLTRDADCAAMTSLRGVDRWSQSPGGILLRDRRGRVLFRFVEAGPTALRARWRRNDFVMMARDLRAFAGAPPQGAPSTIATRGEADKASAPSGHVGTWRIRGAGRRACLVRLTVDPETAATRARPEGCQGPIATADGWSVRRGALVLERGGVPLARFAEGRGVTWYGRFEGGRGGLRMVKQ